MTTTYGVLKWDDYAGSNIIDSILIAVVSVILG